jgi:hypothetical protein
MNPPIEIDCVPTRKETAERLRVSVRTLSRMESRGELSPGIKIGARFRLARFDPRLRPKRKPQPVGWPGLRFARV